MGKQSSRSAERKKRKEFNYPNFFGIILAHIFALCGIWYLFIYGISLTNWILFGIFSLLTGFGITIGYHRMLTHRGFQCSQPLRWALAIMGGMAGEGYEYEWVANHRVHHFFSDQEQDPHSPRAYPGIKGFLWAHIGWLFFKYERPDLYKTFQDLDRDPVTQWQRKFYLLIVISGFIIPFLISGLSGILISGFLRLVFVWHSTWSVNSICHLFGSRAKDAEGNLYTRDDSRNNILIALFALGEGYHSNHHFRPTWAYHGWEWHNLDMSKWMIQSFEWLGLIWNVKKPVIDKGLLIKEIPKIA
jgi:stearoyl-CoA desaturase (delta-9 desaturase)